MNQKALTVVIDEWTAAVERLAEHAPPDAIAQLRQATGDLLEAFGSTATNMATHEVIEVRRLITELDKRTDRRHEDSPHDDERRVGD